MSNNEHFVSGRKSEPSEVARTLAALEDADGVVLYFHGGLSSSRYVEDKLGPWLLNSIFRHQNLGRLFPVFVNYDAGILDYEKLRDFFMDVSVNAVLKRLEGLFQRELEKAIRAGIVDEDERLARAGRRFLAAGRDKSALLKTEFDEEEVAGILEDPAAQRNMEAVLESNDQKVAEVARDIEVLVAQKGLPTSLGLASPAKLIIRIAARFALRTHHEFVPTIAEELIRELSLFNAFGLDDFVQHHWETVYERTEECWQDGKNGFRLIEGLAILRKSRKLQGKEFPIHVVSHSAGAIAASRLVAHLGATSGPVLNQVILLVPAVNHSLFAETFVKYPTAYENFRAFVLDRKMEEGDNLVPVLYTASLLYFVSGAAEKVGYGDRMLLIEHHLRRRKPYSSLWYARTLGRKQGDYKKVWEFFDTPGRVVYCPDPDGELGHSNDGTTHPNTKFPWQTRKLAKSVLFLLTGRVFDDTDIPYPPDIEP